MSASTRTVQQPLGINRLGTALAVVALILVAAVAIALGSLGATKATVAPAPAAPPAVIDHGWSQAGTDLGIGAPPVGYDHGSSQSSMGATYEVPGYRGDPGLAPRTTDRVGNAGSNGPRLRAQ